MRWVAAGLTLVNFATLAGLIFGITGSGLRPFTAAASFSIGIFAAVLAYLKTSGGRPIARENNRDSSWYRYRTVWKWLVMACFVIFAVRSFCWLLYVDNDQLRIQSPNNLGDLALHVTFIKNFANGVALWPNNPIFQGSKLRYPAGIDLFNALLYLQNVDLIPGLVWVGLLGSAATFCTFYRWGGAFSVAAFLFNGGLVGFQFLNSHAFVDYQGVTDVAWKSIPLSMFVTQRGLLYAIPAGLLLLWHWREKFSRNDGGPGSTASEKVRTKEVSSVQGSPLPFWVELSLYASMPLFHVHTFLALSGVLVFLFACGEASTRRQVALLIAAAFLPATFFVWLISDHFRAGSVFAFHPGWVQRDGEFAAPFFVFWLKNFGFWVPLILGAISFFVWRLTKIQHWSYRSLPADVVFMLAATGIFVFAYCVKTAPWGWDNLKIMIWAYFLILPFLWNSFLKTWSVPLRVFAITLLFGSGFVSLFGGLAAGRPGFGFADRAEVDGVGNAIAKFPVEARFAAYPTFNHPLLLQGRDVVMGYPGHLWTEGFDYGDVLQKLNQLLNGASNWEEIARHFQVRYIFWGREEAINYPASKRPWENTLVLAVSGPWGAIYDLRSPNAQVQASPVAAEH